MNGIGRPEASPTKPAGAGDGNNEGHVGAAREPARSDRLTDKPELVSSASDKQDSQKPAMTVNDQDSKDWDPDKSDSEAETIVLPEAQATRKREGKEIKHEEDVEVERSTALADIEMADAVPESSSKYPVYDESMGHPSVPSEQKPPVSAQPAKQERTTHDKANSSGLSSIPSSPIAETQSSKHDSPSDHSRSSPPHVGDDKLRTGEGGSRKRKLGQEEPRGSSEWKEPKPKTKHASDSENKARRERQSSSHTHRVSRDRSSSPRFRNHKRAASTQSASSQLTNGHNNKKRRVPAPLLSGHERKHSEDAYSDTSSRADSPHLHGHIRNLHSADSTLSPMKMPHKKHRDQIGRTFLARACANREIDNARIRLNERPEDIDVADNAGNTPLQIAALEGCEDIVQLLIEGGCDINCKNNDKDTPLIDAVENGHLAVVRLLLDAGADPRQGNLNGEEPLDLLDPEDENYGGIKEALELAKRRHHPRRASEEHGQEKDHGRYSRGTSAISPRDSPPLFAPRSPPIHLPPRRRTVRSEATRNDLLWMKPTLENLRDRAGKGDMAGVGTILNVLPQADTESLIAAAKGGHDEVIQLLLGLGNANADPEPLRSLNYKPGFNTPMLAAIGRGNEKVLQLLLAQPNFDPTKRDYRGRTYYEIAEERQGSREEYDLLKEAYDKAIASRKKGRNSNGLKVTSSPETSRKHREKDKIAKHHDRDDSPSHGSDNFESGKIRSLSDRDGSTKKLKHDDPERPRPRKRLTRPEGAKDPSAVVSDRETTSLAPPKTKPTVRRTESDTAVALSEDDHPKPRRKLISGKDLKSDRNRQRRGSIHSSTSSSSSKDAISALEKPEMTKQQIIPHASSLSQKMEKVSSIPTAIKSSASDSEIAGGSHRIKREESKDNPGVSHDEGGSKRPRDSPTQFRSRSQDPEFQVSPTTEAKKKRRRVENEADSNAAFSGQTAKLISRETVEPVAQPDEPMELDRREPNDPTNNTAEKGEDGVRNRPASGMGLAVRHDESQDQRQTCPANLDHGAIRTQRPPELKDLDTDNPRDLHRNAQADEDTKRAEVARAEREDEERKQEEEKKKLEEQKKKQEEERKKQEEERKKQEEEERKKQQLEEERKKQEEEEKKKKKKLEEERKKQEEEEKKLEEERRRREQEEREEEERRARAAKEEEQRRLAEQKFQAEELERKVRIAREEQARVERKQREEEAHRRRVEQERLRRLEQERKRAELEERERLLLKQRQEEEERLRREALPNSLARAANLEESKARSAAEAKRWLPLFTVTTSQMNREQPENLTEERWVVNFQVAPVLGIKDLELSQFTAWEKRSLTDRQRTCIWRVARRMLAESDEPTPLNSSIQGLAKLDAATAAKFFDMKHVFWIKLSDFIDIVPRYPHLRDVPVTTLPVCLEYLDGPNGPIFPERKVTRQRPDNTFQSQLNDAQPQRNFNNSMEAVMHQMPQHAPALPNGFIH